MPYLKYWLEDVASLTDDADDAAWTCALFDYIAFYEFKGAQKLFKAFGEDISPGSPRYQELRVKEGVDQRLKDALLV